MAKRPLICKQFQIELKQKLKIKRIDELKKFTRDEISRLPLPMDDRAAILHTSMMLRIGAEPRTEWCKALAGFEIAEAAILLFEFRKSIVESPTSLSKKMFFDNIALSTIDAFFTVFDAADFYAGRRQIGFFETPAAQMAMEDGLISSFEHAAPNIRLFADGFRTSKLFADLLPLSIYSLYTLLNSFCGREYDTQNFDWKAMSEELCLLSKETLSQDLLAEVRDALAYVELGLKNLQTVLRLREHEIFDKHTKWRVLVLEDDPDGPYDASVDRQNQSRELHKYYREHRNPLGCFIDMTRHLNEQVKSVKANDLENDPRPFTDRDFDLSTDVAHLLSTPVRICYDSPAWQVYERDGEYLGTDQLNPWLSDAKTGLGFALITFCDERAKRLPQDSLAKRLWTRVVAEFLCVQQYSIDTFPFSRDDAESIVKLARDAAKEEWIERRIANMKSDGRKSIQELLESILENQQQGSAQHPTSEQQEPGTDQWQVNSEMKECIESRQPKMRGRKSGRTGAKYDQFIAAKKLYEDPGSDFFENAYGAAARVLGWTGTAKKGKYVHELQGYSLCGSHTGVSTLARRLSRKLPITGRTRKPGRKVKRLK